MTYVIIDIFPYKCTKNKPCDEGQGVCSKDTQCKNGLRCGDRNCPFKTENSFNETNKCCFRSKG